MAGLFAAVTPALVVMVAPVAMAGLAGGGLQTGGQQVNGQTISPKSLDPVSFIDAGIVATPEVDLVVGGAHNINWDNTNINVVGPLLATGTIRSNSQYLNGNGGIEMAFSQDFTNATDLEGNVSDSASNSAVGIGSANTMTAGMDRYIATFYSNGWSTVRSQVASNGTYLNKAAVGTAASGTGVTAVYSGAGPYWLSRVTVTNAAMTAAASTDISVVPATPGFSRITAVVAGATQVFTGGALSAVTVQCGNVAGGTQYLLANSVFTAQNVWGDANNEIGLNLIPGNAAYAPYGTMSAGVDGAVLVSCRFICTGANCNAATQGSVTFYVEGVTYF